LLENLDTVTANYIYAHAEEDRKTPAQIIGAMAHKEMMARLSST
jgi:hypothetical protein